MGHRALCAPAIGPGFLPLLCCQGDRCVFTFPGVSQMGWEPGARAEGTGVWLTGGHNPGWFTPSFLCGPVPFAGVAWGSDFLEGTGPGARRCGVEAGSILSLSPSGSGVSASAAIPGCKLGCEECRTWVWPCRVSAVGPVAGDFTTVSLFLITKVGTSFLLCRVPLTWNYSS